MTFSGAGPGLEDQRDLSTVLARRALERAAPDELMFFDESAAEYFADRGKALSGDNRDETLGFGIELALLAPFALAVAEYLVGLVGDLFADAVKDVANPRIAAVFRRLVPSGSSRDGSKTEDFTREQRQQVYQAALAEGERLGLEASTATLLAHAMVGALDVHNS
ncbi:hypothetical protein ACFRJ9_12980 [Paenarthrobacter sp. NPDC056912]|uniref:hypothetical protein n=1 Tax=Paenarthrobacter sp. NPDC056912 TaxID=3345965 RepID=UPI00366D0635